MHHRLYSCVSYGRARALRVREWKVRRGAEGLAVRPWVARWLAARGGAARRACAVLEVEKTELVRIRVRVKVRVRAGDGPAPC